MPRGRPPQPWVKLHYTILNSAINYEMNLSQQMIYIKLLVFSSNCGQIPGVLSDNDGRPIPEKHLADCIHAPVKIVMETIKIGLATNRFNKNGSTCLELSNYNYYQSEYFRQKPYRQAAQEARKEEARGVNTLISEKNREYRETIKNKEKELGRQLTPPEGFEIKNIVDKKYKQRFSDLEEK